MFREAASLLCNSLTICRIIENKRNVPIFRVIGKHLSSAHDPILDYKPRESFDESGLLRPEAFSFLTDSSEQQKEQPRLAIERPTEPQSGGEMPSQNIPPSTINLISYELCRDLLQMVTAELVDISAGHARKQELWARRLFDSVLHMCIRYTDTIHYLPNSIANRLVI